MKTSTGPVTTADFSRLKTRYPYVTLLPLVQYLEFITEEANCYPHFQLPNERECVGADRREWRGSWGSVPQGQGHA